MREIGRQIIGDPVGEKILLLVAAHVFERQHDDGEPWRVGKLVLDRRAQQARCDTRMPDIGPASLERRWLAAEAWRRFNAMSAEARREYYFEKKARWLTNVLVTERYRRVFRLRCQGDDGNMVDLETWIHKRAHPVTLLLKLMRMRHAPLVLRLDCAKTAARYLYRKPKAVVAVVIDGGLSRPQITVLTDEQKRERHRENARRSYARLKHRA
jgi:hypothetical protein